MSGEDRWRLEHAIPMVIIGSSTREQVISSDGARQGTMTLNIAPSDPKSSTAKYRKLALDWGGRVVSAIGRMDLAVEI
jgi:hypothetical protein